jgi:flagellin
LTSGQSINVAGLTFTAGSAGISATDLAKAYGAATAAATASTVNTALLALIPAIPVTAGTFTSGQLVAGGTFHASSGVFTAATGSATQISLTPGWNESSKITFPALAAGQSITVGGLKFAATAAMADTAVAGAFASLAIGATTGPANASGTYTGTLAGFATGPASTNTLFATSSTSSVNVADIVVTGPGAVSATNGLTVAASTVYGSVQLTSNSPFIIKPGANAYNQGASPAVDPTYANFTALGFKAETINAKNIGRLSFQVGPAENQLINIDMADFGPDGDITGPITSSKAPTNIRTVQSSNDVIMNVNKSLDQIAEVRATMGAVMNRLEHVMDNLTNVVMNSEASRSQIEDADYAQASTELARTQIMQQAATAVLAQANTSQQTVLKLLQG